MHMTMASKKKCKSSPVKSGQIIDMLSMCYRGGNEVVYRRRLIDFCCQHDWDKITSAIAARISSDAPHPAQPDSFDTNFRAASDDSTYTVSSGASSANVNDTDEGQINASNGRHAQSVIATTPESQYVLPSQNASAAQPGVTEGGNAWQIRACFSVSGTGIPPAPNTMTPFWPGSTAPMLTWPGPKDEDLIFRRKLFSLLY